MEERQALPWWIQEGMEICGFCLQRYSYEVEYRCTACDRAVCPMCVLQVGEQLEAYCPECNVSDENG